MINVNTRTQPILLLMGHINPDIEVIDLVKGHCPLRTAWATNYVEIVYEIWFCPALHYKFASADAPGDAAAVIFSVGTTKVERWTLNSYTIQDRIYD